MTEAEAEEIVWRHLMRPTKRQLAEAESVLEPITAEAWAWVRSIAEAHK